ncbi:MAG: L-threonylcarbamoyladenylate synthase [Oscillatoriales cyanobacterium SM2_1_8]|nr:L-threonylcarbamoyladenylate synthase [Oscillatoriales cyanobacterium SM2_1_8]
MLSFPSFLLAVRQGAVAALPTDTVPALAAIPQSRDRIYLLKRRDPNKPLILMGATAAELADYVDFGRFPPSLWKTVVTSCWPGAITLVLPANGPGQGCNPGQDTLGLRIPNHPIALAVLQQTGPLLTTSANRSGEPPLRSWREIQGAFPEVVIGTVPDPGSGQPSTVVAWQGDRWETLRPGAHPFPGYES